MGDGMVLRSILLFPQFENREKIDALREQYDPLVGHVGPHVTVVFPFESEIGTEELRRHVVQAVNGIVPFAMVFQGVTGADGGYLFLNVKRGNDQVIELHDRLYTGLLQEFLHRKVTYVPHITVGKLKDEQSFEAALAATEGWDEVFETVIEQVIVEIIAENGDSIVEFEVPLERGI